MQLRSPLIALVAAISASGSQAQSDQELKAMLDHAMKTIQALQERVDALGRQRPAPAAPPAQPAAPPGAPGSVTVGASGAKSDEGVKDADKARVEAYGQAMLDAIYDFRTVDPEWIATLRPSKIPITCPGCPGCGKDGATIFSVRQSATRCRRTVAATPRARAPAGA
jgi:hypothetical protein